MSRRESEAARVVRQERRRWARKVAWIREVEAAEYRAQRAAELRREATARELRRFLR